MILTNNNIQELEKNYKFNDFNQLTPVINKLTSEHQKTEHGFFARGLYDVDGKRFLLKEPNNLMFEINEVYQLAIVKEVLGEENATECLFTKNEKGETMILSKWIESTENFFTVFKKIGKVSEVDYFKYFIEHKPKNFISSMFVSIILENMDPSFTNFLVNKDCKFYLIDTLIPNKTNHLDLHLEECRKQIGKIFYNFIDNFDKKNVKKQIAKLFTDYFQIHNDGFLTQMKRACKKGKTEPGDASNIFDIHEQILWNDIIGKMIEVIDEKSVMSELKLIKRVNLENIKKIGEYFESDKYFPGYGKYGIECGYYENVVSKFEKFNQLELDESTKVFKQVYVSQTFRNSVTYEAEKIA